MTDILNSKSLVKASEYSSVINWKAEAELWRERYESTRVELDEFTTSSLELEQELEKELHHSLQQCKQLKNDLRVSHDEVASLKESEKRNLQCISALQGKLQEEAAQKAALVLRVRQLEQANDNLEITNRNLTASLGNYMERVDEIAENKALLETELEKSRKYQENERRLKDQIQELESELSVLRRHLHRGKYFTNPDATVTTSRQMVRHEALMDNLDNELIMLRLLADGDFAAADQMSVTCKYSVANGGENPCSPRSLLR